MIYSIEDFEVARRAYMCRRGKEWLSAPLRAALIDMDGVLYDSMPWHARAWHRMMAEIGVETTVDEFFAYEGMTGKATIDLLFRRVFGREADEEEVSRLYSRKTEIFKAFGRKDTMKDADRMLAAFEEMGIRKVLVTGSGQKSLISRIDSDYPGAFAETDRVTALDVKRGKPDPEPYLRGLEKAGCRPEEAIVIENAPLGVRAGVAAGCFTIAVTTGPIPREAFVEEKADMIFPSMPEFADFLHLLSN